MKDHKEDLNTIKTLKQEILGQQHKLEEYQNQIANGFVTINGGHRVGVSGSCVMERRKSNQY